MLERPPRAAIAFADGARIEALPIAYRREAGRHFVRVARDLLPAAGAPGHGVLLADDGRYWFELRAVTLRGAAIDFVPERAEWLQA